MADQGAEGLLSPWLRKQRLKVAKPYLNGRVLDMGCGSGALAGLVKAEHYVGVDIDTDSLELARSRFPKHSFKCQLHSPEKSFDTVVALAVIEHVEVPGEFLDNLAAYMKDSIASRLIVTTPHPSMDWVHDAGAMIGLFSRHANEEHETLLDHKSLVKAGKQAGLHLVSYRRFLFGANQIAVFQKYSR